METKRSNMSIACTVAHCEHHNPKESSCSLSAIQVGRCGPAKDTPACTECNSFKTCAR